MPFAEVLKKLRTEAGMTQEQLAERAGIAISSLRNHEQGHRAPSWPAVVKLARALGVKADVFSECDEVKEEQPASKPRKGKK